METAFFLFHGVTRGLYFSQPLPQCMHFLVPPVRRLTLYRHFLVYLLRCLYTCFHAPCLTPEWQYLPRSSSLYFLQAGVCKELWRLSKYLRFSLPRWGSTYTFFTDKEIAAVYWCYQELPLEQLFYTNRHQGWTIYAWFYSFWL